MITKSILFFVLVLFAFTFAVPAGPVDTGSIAVSIQETSADSLPKTEPQATAKETSSAPAESSKNSPSFIGILMVALLFGFLFSFLKRRR